MAIEISTKTVEIKEQDRTYELVITTPPDGNYKVAIFRHTVDSNTKRELSREATPHVMSLAEMQADPDVAALLTSVPAIMDRIVTTKRAEKAAAIAAAIAAAEAAAAAAAAGGGE